MESFEEKDEFSNSCEDELEDKALFSLDEKDEEYSSSNTSSDRESGSNHHTELLMRVKAPQVLKHSLYIQKLPGIFTDQHNSGFRICGCNLDKTVQWHLMQLDKSNVSLHYFQFYAVLINYVDISSLSNDIPENSSISNFRSVALSLLPFIMDDKILKDNTTTPIRIEFFKVCFDDLAHWHVEHKWLKSL